MLAFLICLVAGAPERLSLQDALGRARVSAREVVLARNAVKEAEASRVGQGVFLPVNPRIYGDYRRIATELVGQPVDPRDGLNIGIDGLLEISGAGFARVREAKERTKVAEHDFDTIRADALEQAWLSYVSAQVAEAQRIASTEALELQLRVEQATSERVRLGVSSEAESAAVGVELVGVRTLVLEGQRVRELALHRLKQSLDMQASTPLELDELSQPPQAAKSVDTLVAEALQKRPELATARARLGLLDATDSRLFREALPKLGYNGGLDAAPASPAFAFVGISIEIPVAQRNQGPRAIVRAQKESEQTRIDTAMRSIAREVAATFGSYRDRRAQFEMIDRDALPLAQKSAELVEAGWRAGRFDIFRFTNTTRELLRIKRERLELLLAAWSDYVALQRATGGLQ